MNSRVSITMLLLCAFASLVSCSHGITERIPLNSKIIAKYRVLDEYMSPGFVKCSEERREFSNAGPHDCSFKLYGLEFVIERKYLVDSIGKLKEYWPYHAEGPEIFTRQELEKDTSLMQSEGLNNFHISANEKVVIDGRDTVAITRVFPKERLLFTDRSTKDSVSGRRIIYQYQ